MLAELDKFSTMQGKVSWDPVLWNWRWFYSFRLQPLQLYVTVPSEPRRGKKTCFKKNAVKLPHHNFFSTDQSHYMYYKIYKIHKQSKRIKPLPCYCRVTWKQQRWHFSTTRASKGHGTDRWGPFSKLTRTALTTVKPTVRACCLPAKPRKALSEIKNTKVMDFPGTRHCGFDGLPQSDYIKKVFQKPGRCLQKHITCSGCLLLSHLLEVIKWQVDLLPQIVAG